MAVTVQIHEADFSQIMFLDTDMDSSAVCYEFIAGLELSADAVKSANEIVPAGINQPDFNYASFENCTDVNNES